MSHPEAVDKSRGYLRFLILLGRWTAEEDSRPHRQESRPRRPRAWWSSRSPAMLAGHSLAAVRYHVTEIKQVPTERSLPASLLVGTNIDVGRQEARWLQASHPLILCSRLSWPSG